MHIVAEGDFKEIKNIIKQELTKHDIKHSTLEFEEKDENCNNKFCDIKKTPHSHHH